MVVGASDGVGHPNKQGRPFYCGHKYPRVSGFPLTRGYHCDVGRLNGLNYLGDSCSRSSSDCNDHYTCSQAVGACETLERPM